MPKVTTTLSLLSEIHGVQSLQELLPKIDIKLRKYLEEELDLKVMTDEQKEFRSSLHEKVKDPVFFHVLALAGTSCGVREEVVEDLFGLEGIKILLNLFQEDYVQMEKGHFHASEKGIAFHRSIIKPIINTSVEFLETKGSSIKTKNFYYHWSESLNESGIEKLITLQRNFYKELKDALADPKNHGDQHYFFFGAIDSYKC
ncbi:hypothetical protein BMS_1496 [Halobacteriovorax marinus SJ]|uniref:Uncharacterized protein n=2 Tax=Halobacteriovorax marinus TaxID=97084 RepID=E1X0C5_HALMS|nr:hypothetical protein BMS_1496 [Halobacteriovorax marinus SJ]